MATQMGGDSSRGLSMTARRTRGAAGSLAQGGQALLLMVAWREEDTRFCWELVVRMTRTADGGLDAGSRQPMGRKQHVDGVENATQRLRVVGLDAGSRQPLSEEDLSMATQMGGDSSRGLSMTARTRGAAGSLARGGHALLLGAGRKDDAHS
jgi:hypothetical protein